MHRNMQPEAVALHVEDIYTAAARIEVSPPEFSVFVALRAHGNRTVTVGCPVASHASAHAKVF